MTNGSADDARGDGGSAPAATLRCPSCGSAQPAENDRCAHCGTGLRTRRCVRCFVLNARDAERCARCGTLLPEPERSDAAAGPCPDCGVALTARAFGPVAYAECDRCGGLFVRPKAFEAVSHDADTRARVRLEKPLEIRTAAAPPPHVKYRACPECRKLMNRTNYAGGSGIVVDNCRAHGWWFDRGELTAIVDFLEGGGWDRLKRRERERVAEDVRTLERQKSISQTLSPPTGSYDRESRGWESIGDIVEFLAGLVGWLRR